MTDRFDELARLINRGDLRGMTTANLAERLRCVAKEGPVESKPEVEQELRDMNARVREALRQCEGGYNGTLVQYEFEALYSLIAGLLRARDASAQSHDAAWGQFDNERGKRLAVEQERDAAIARAKGADEDWLQVAHAVGIVHAPDTGPCYPGPTLKILETIAQNRRDAAEAEELRARVTELEGKLVEWQGYLAQSKLDRQDEFREYRRGERAADARITELEGKLNDPKGPPVFQERIAALEERLAERTEQLGRRQREATSYAERNDTLRKLNEELRTQVASAARKQRRACCEAIGSHVDSLDDDTTINDVNWPEVVRRTPLVTDAPPRDGYEPADDLNRMHKIAPKYEPRGVCFDESQPSPTDQLDDERTKGDADCYACQNVWGHHHSRECGSICGAHNYGPSCSPGLVAPGSLRIVDPPTQEEDEYTDERCDQEMATLGWDPSPRCVFNAIKRRNARIAELLDDGNQLAAVKGVLVAVENARLLEAAEKRIAELESCQTSDAQLITEKNAFIDRIHPEYLRLRAKCSRQRQELRRLNRDGVIAKSHEQCNRTKRKELEATLGVTRLQLSALRAERESAIGRIVRATSYPDDANLDNACDAVETMARKMGEMRAENEKLKAKEAPETAWLRALQWIESHEEYSGAASTPYQPPQAAPAEPSPEKNFTDIGMTQTRPGTWEFLAETSRCRVNPEWNCVNPECPEHSGKAGK